ncbi:unnamed protein product [Protopolystoma xenopodis]|uniref:Uncharacterized protein n=1 Tax=Protopolystoma xenopodis TaxID=117903 RepID=A0A448WEJ3_9PLAT|nr:unnamed protein product [Protopolystoma xenopodis]
MQSNSSSSLNIVSSVNSSYALSSPSDSAEIPSKSSPMVGYWKLRSTRGLSRTSRDNVTGSLVSTPALLSIRSSPLSSLPDSNTISSVSTSTSCVNFDAGPVLAIDGSADVLFTPILSTTTPDISAINKAAFPSASTSINSHCQHATSSVLSAISSTAPRVISPFFPQSSISIRPSVTSIHDTFPQEVCHSFPFELR